MEAEIETLSPSEAREQAYLLLAGRSPGRVMIDRALQPGEWYVVRGPYEHERALVAVGKSEVVA